MIDLKTILPERLNTALKESGHNARWLALMTEITECNLSHYLNGKRLPEPTNLAKICKALNVSADWVLGISDSPELNQK